MSYRLLHTAHETLLRRGAVLRPASQQSSRNARNLSRSGAGYFSLPSLALTSRDPGEGSHRHE